VIWQAFFYYLFWCLLLWSFNALLNIAPSIQRNRFFNSVHGYLWLWVSALLFRIIHYQNVASGVKKFEGKACRGAARLSEDGGLARRSFCVNWEVSGISQEKIAGCRIYKVGPVILEKNKIMSPSPRQ